MTRSREFSALRPGPLNNASGLTMRLETEAVS